MSWFFPLIFTYFHCHTHVCGQTKLIIGFLHPLYVSFRPGHATWCNTHCVVHSISSFSREVVQKYGPLLRVAGQQNFAGTICSTHWGAGARRARPEPLTYASSSIVYPQTLHRVDGVALPTLSAAPPHQHSVICRYFHATADAALFVLPAHKCEK